MKRKDIMDWTVREFKKLPMRKHFDTPIECESLIILPSKRKHDSGWRIMYFVAVKDGKPICICSGCSDVLDIDGIGGVGLHSQMKQVKPRAWKIDCLPKSGLLRLSCNNKMQLGPSLSNFQVFATDKPSFDGDEIPF